MRAVELGDGGVEQLLVPALERVDALDRAGGIGLEVLDHGVDVGAGDDALGDLAHRVLDAVQLVPPPRVRLVEVELDAVEVLRVQRVALAPTGSRSSACGAYSSTRNRPSDAYASVARVASVSRRARNAGSPSPDASYSSTSAWKNGRVVAVDATPGVGLLACTRPPAGAPRRRPRPRPRPAPASMLDEPLGHERHALGDDLPVVGGVAGHEVERHAHGLHRAAEHAEVAQPLTGVVLGERELEPFAHHLGGDAVGVGLCSVGGVERAQRRRGRARRVRRRRRGRSRSSRGRGRRCPHRWRRADRARRTARRSASARS